MLARSSRAISRISFQASAHRSTPVLVARSRRHGCGPLIQPLGASDARNERARHVPAVADDVDDARLRQGGAQEGNAQDIALSLLGDQLPRARRSAEPLANAGPDTGRRVSDIQTMRAIGSRAHGFPEDEAP